MLNARKLALALQHCRNEYVRIDGTFLISDGTVVYDNADTADVNALYTDDDNVTLVYRDGSRYRVEIHKER